MKKQRFLDFKIGDLVKVVTKSWDSGDELICELSEDPTRFTVVKPGCVGILFKIDKQDEPFSYHVAVEGQKVVLYRSYICKLS